MRRFAPRALLAAILLCCATLLASPAGAAVTITFWSHEFGDSFPHAFVTLRGTPDGGGAPVDRSVGFTAKSVTPAILMGNVKGKIETPGAFYVLSSDAQFSVVLTDAAYARMLALIAAWDERTGDGHYNLNARNCVHFVREAARIAGLAGIDQPRLMKRPRSYLRAVAAANPGAVTPVGLRGKAYLATLPPLAAGGPVAAAR